ncbi:MAG: LPD38 domain-containing protein [Christensenellales bacterium]
MDTAKKVAKGLGLGQDIGTRKIPKNVQGFFNTRAKFLAAGSRYASDATTLFHEVGHALQHKMGITGTQAMIDALPEGFRQAYSKAELPGEAFAEFTWRYLANEEQARAFAGDFYDVFEQAVRTNKLDKLVGEAKTELRSYLSASLEARALGMIKDRSYKPRVSIGERFRNVVSGLFDTTRAAADVDAFVKAAAGDNYHAGESLRNQALLRNTAERRAYNIFTRGLTNASWEVVGDSLQDRLDKTGIRGDQFDSLMSYMTTLHSLDRDSQGKPVFDAGLFPREQRIQYVNEIRQKHPEIAKAEQAFQEFRHEFLTNFMVDTGYMSATTLQKFELMYPHYVPTYRVKSLTNKGVGVNGEYRIMAAKGSTEELYNPMDSFIDMANTIVKQVSQNNTALAFHRAYQKYEGLGIFGHRVTSDKELIYVDTTNIQDKVQAMLEQETSDRDLISEVVALIGAQQIRKRDTNDVNLPNIVHAQLPDGSRVFYQMEDQALFDMLAETRDQGDSALDTIGKVTRSMAMLTTGANPLFMARNFARDFQKSVNYGSWASNYLSGSAKWLGAFYDVWRNKGEYANYTALGGGGWTRLQSNTKVGAEAYRSELFKGYNTSNAGRTAKYAGKKIWNALTLSRLNEIVEQTSRYAEYKYGKQDKSTAEGKQQAFLNAQEATVDFTRQGGQSSFMRNVIPFFNAAAQGVYQTGRAVADPAERSRLPARFTKTLLNVGIATALEALLRAKFTGDDEKEEYANLSDDIRAKNFILPNPAPAVFGEAPYLRIPLAQDPLSVAVHSVLSNTIDKGERDDYAIGMSAIADGVLDLMNPFSGTIFDPVIATMTNKNWYGSNIVPRYLQEKYGNSPEMQYTETTPEVFTEVSHAAGKLGARISPMMLEYAAGQYLGFLGQVAIPALTKVKNSDEIVGLSGALARARKQFTTDPLISTDVISSLYDADSDLTAVVSAVADSKPADTLRVGLSPDEIKQAHDEAYALTHTDGAVYEAKKLIGEGYNRIAEIDDNPALSAKEKYQLTSEIRREMIESALSAQEEVGSFKEKYVTGASLLTLFQHNPDVDPYTAFDKLGAPFKTALQKGEDYMAKAKEVWDTTSDSSALPRLNLTFSKDGTEYTLEGEDAQVYELEYTKAYQDYVRKNSVHWEAMTPAERLSMMEKAHTAGHNAGKKSYFRKIGL